MLLAQGGVVLDNVRITPNYAALRFYSSSFIHFWIPTSPQNHQGLIVLCPLGEGPLESPRTIYPPLF